MKNKNFLILCRVIDNFGDIGVVYRLAKALTDLDPSFNITIVCSDLKSFSAMAEKIDPGKKEQTVTYKNTEWTVLDWEQDSAFNYCPDPFPVILECFQCGRPDWLEKILFKKDLPPEKLYYIFNIEYLTAEQYADDFHLLKSYTRSPNVKKRFFMPGFTSKTGGLIIDSQFRKLIKEKKKINDGNTFTVTLFSYERDFTEIFDALNEFQKTSQKENPEFKVKVLAAAGQSLKCAEKSWEETGKMVEFISLPFLQQEDWDKVLMNADFNFIRGEESLARACLSGIPFVWHAYLQDENYQTVKVQALLDRLLPHIKNDETASAIQNLWINYNTPGQKPDKNDLIRLFDETFAESLRDDFAVFSEKLIKNGDLASNLVNYLEKEFKNR